MADDKIEELGRAWEQFKQTNDLRLKEIEKRGVNDPLHLEHLSKLSGFMDETKTALDAIKVENDAVKAALARTAKAGEGDKNGETAEVKAFNEGFNAFLRKGIDTNLSELGMKAMAVNIEADGGFTVAPQLSSRIIETINEKSPLRALAAVESISTDALELLDYRGVINSGWVSETGTRNVTAAKQFGKKNIPTHEIYAEPAATQKLLDDSAINIEQRLSNDAAEAFAIQEAAAFVAGDGIGKPRGFLTYASGTGWGQIERVNSGSSGAVTADGILKLIYALKEGYTSGASFLMRRASMLQVRLLKETGTGAYLWQTSFQAGQPDSLLGYPVNAAVDMPAVGVDALAIAFGNWKQAYQIVDRKGITLLRDPYTQKGFVLFYFTKRVGGDVVNFEALKLQSLT